MQDECAVLNEVLLYGFINKLIRHIFVTEQGADEAAMAVMFHTDDQSPEEAKVFSPIEAAALGYHISLHGSHLTLRCPYSSPFSYFVKVFRDDILCRGLRAMFCYFFWMRCVGVFPRRVEWI